METDAYFTIGKTHLVCEDYAVAGQTSQGLAYAIVSDGCSSSPRTDFGARFLTTAAEVMLRTHHRMPLNGDVIDSADEARCVLGLPQTCLDATLLVATMNDDELNVRVWGDGEIVILREDGFSWHSVEYVSGAPRYLSYDLNPARREVYEAESDDGRRIHSVRNVWKAGHTRMDTVLVESTGRVPVQLSADAKAVRGILLFSDGLQTFQDTDYSNEQVPVFDVLTQVLAIKNTNGKFLTRRCRKFFGKFCRDNNWQHSDDFSVAGIMR